MSVSLEKMTFWPEWLGAPGVWSAPGCVGLEFEGLLHALGQVQSEDNAFSNVVVAANAARTSRERVFFIGNGGSAGIASHMAADWLKNGGFAAMCFNDPAALTCIANDRGYDNVFALPLQQHAKAGDILIAISSSGMSPNILRAAAIAKTLGLFIITLSGFEQGNKLRQMGDINFYVPSRAYGVVEIAHLAICHAILDKVMEGDKHGEE